MTFIYDLAAKFEGIAAFCHRDITETNIGAALFGDTLETQQFRQRISRLKGGERPLSDDNRIRLSEYFNKLIGQATGRNQPDAGGGPIRPEDWNRPLTEFFSELERHFSSFSDGLDRSHGAIVAAFTALDEHRNTSMPLALTHDTGKPHDGSRFPAAALPVDSITLPTVQFRHGEQMLIQLTQPIEQPSKGWMFFVRNPDTRVSPSDIPNRIWNQPVGDLIRWVQSPFPLETGFFGPLPEFPCPVEALDGEYTAYLLIEQADALGVRRCLESDMGRSLTTSVPTYEATLHMIARARSLFQKGQTGEVLYPPPTLLMRRYRVWNG